MNKLTTKNILLSLLAMLMIFAMGMFKGQINGDRSFHRLNLEQGGEYSYTLDVGKMGVVKYFVEPNIMTLYLRCKVPTEINALRCDVSGFENFASQGSKKGVWKAVAKDEILKIESKGNTVPLNLEIAVPRDDIYKHDVGMGRVTFTNEGAPYAVLNIKIINSKYLKS